MNMKYYRGTMRHQPADADYYIDVYDCSDDDIDRLIEARRNEFRDEWFKYEESFYN